MYDIYVFKPPDFDYEGSSSSTFSPTSIIAIVCTCLHPCTSVYIFNETVYLRILLKRHYDVVVGWLVRGSGQKGGSRRQKGALWPRASTYSALSSHDQCRCCELILNIFMLSMLHHAFFMYSAQNLKSRCLIKLLKMFYTLHSLMLGSQKWYAYTYIHLLQVGKGFN